MMPSKPAYRDIGVLLSYKDDDLVKIPSIVAGTVKGGARLGKLPKIAGIAKIGN
jgi:hypothetical protein